VRPTIATTRVGAALAPTIFSGKHATVKPVGGNAARLHRRSICEYGRSAWWAAQKMPGSSLPGGVRSRGDDSVLATDAALARTGAECV